MLIPKACLLLAGAFLALAKAEACEEECTMSYSPHTNEQTAGLHKNCLRGCRLFNVVDGALRSKENLNETIKTCQHSCEDALANDKAKDHVDKLTACQSGCALQAPNAMKRRSKNQSILDLFFGNGGQPIVFGIPRIQMETGSNNIMFPKMSDWMNTNMRSLMEAMDQSVGNMMSQMRQQMENMPQLGPSRSGRIVVQSGPGFHKETIYNIGPNGEVVTVLKNDMIERGNPLDESFDKKDVELFDPLQASNKQKTEVEVENIIAPILNEIGRDMVQSRRDIVYGNNVLVVEEPHLPESGLKSRPNPYYYAHDICRQDSHKMKWADWVSCLHLRLGMPRWFMTATLCLGIIFLLWLCLVIPNNAPKQRIKTPKMTAKEAEALSVITITKEITGDSGHPVDLPPAYEDVANLQVKLEPVHQAGPKKMTGQEEKA